MRSVLIIARNQIQRNSGGDKEQKDQQNVIKTQFGPRCEFEEKAAIERPPSSGSLRFKDRLLILESSLSLK